MYRQSFRQLSNNEACVLSTLLIPMKKILLLGSGELGKEFVISAKRLGCHVIACDSYAGAPAMQVADESCVFNMLDEGPLRAAIAQHQPDLIVPEIEAIRTEVLLDVEKQGFEVIPSARAANLTMNRDRIRDVAVSLGVRTAQFSYADSADELLALQPDAIILSPGPGAPEAAGCFIDVLHDASPQTPLLGVCLGHQAIGGDGSEGGRERGVDAGRARRTRGGVTRAAGRERRQGGGQSQSDGARGTRQAAGPRK